CTDYYQKHGQMMSGDWQQQIDGYEAVLFSGVGWTGVVPDHIYLWEFILKFRRDFARYINLRRVRLLLVVSRRLANKKPGDIDFVVVRESTEGEYTNLGGRIFSGTEREMVIQESVFTRTGVDRVLHFAFDVAQKRSARHLSAATK